MIYIGNYINESIQPIAKYGTYGQLASQCRLVKEI